MSEMPRFWWRPEEEAGARRECSFTFWMTQGLPHKLSIFALRPIYTLCALLH
ncbi:hypothetical protein BV25DRAFT_1818584 [Artomyces pyxidatus]|uniref:Uncharacterized protein n=1 Tax=Artomyces pyxidatus TaxID=48021 RepID=A0ACB8TIH1_9AGAM|nr:hypothetical protein BV25DRAFT_1818584 [Artomyces pyxidatus]